MARKLYKVNINCGLGYAGEIVRGDPDLYASQVRAGVLSEVDADGERLASPDIFPNGPPRARPQPRQRLAEERRDADVPET